MEKICYFDFDVIFNCDIAEFYNLDIKKYHLIGCEDDANKSFSRQIRLKKIKSKRLSPIAEKLISHPQYICAGVLLFNIEKIRSDNLTEKFIQEMSNNYAFGDQDVLNILCEKKINNYYGITPLHTFFYCKYVFNFKICHCTFPKQ
ncbi:MAG: hypothetical protein LBC61_05420 [Candidatus Peribacteria bacterium]|nr:hypothetical protein [Candidatus Peribacteria bacterium]